MNAIAKVSPGSSPVRDQAAARALALASNLLFRDYAAAPEFLSEPLSPVTRSTLSMRLGYLEQVLGLPAPADLRRIASAVAGLLGAFPSNTTGSPEATVTKFVQVVSDLPAWAVVAACGSIEGGSAEGASLDYRPSAPRLRQVAKNIMVPWIEERFQLRRVLLAPALAPEDADMRERLKVRMAQFADDLRMGKYKTEGTDA